VEAVEFGIKVGLQGGAAWCEEILGFAAAQADSQALPLEVPRRALRVLKEPGKVLYEGWPELPNYHGVVRFVERGIEV